MWPIIGILLVGGVISLFEITPRVKKKHWREIIVYFLFLLPGMTLSILLSLNIDIPSPLDILIKIFSPVTDFIDRILT